MEYFSKSRDIRKAEGIIVVPTDKNSHFTGAIVQNAHETENITSTALTTSGYNRLYIRGVNIQSIENLHYRLIFWSKNIFDDTDLDIDTYVDHVDLDMPTNSFRINATNQYYLDVSGLGIIYEDENGEYTLHVSLQNLSAATKPAGDNIQIDMSVTPRM